MSGLNKVILIGNLGSEVELRALASGTPVANFRMATSEYYKGKQNTEWHRIVVFGKLAETCSEYLATGRQIYVEGKLRTRSWKDRDGHTRYTTEIVGNRVQFLGNPFSKKKDSNPETVYINDPAFEDLGDDDCPF